MHLRVRATRTFQQYTAGETVRVDDNTYHRLLLSAGLLELIAIEGEEVEEPPVIESDDVTESPVKRKRKPKKDAPDV